MDDTDVARRVSALILLAAPDDRDEVLRSQVPPAQFARVLTLIPGVMAQYMDAVTARDKRVRLGLEGVLRTFLRETRE